MKPIRLLLTLVLLSAVSFSLRAEEVGLDKARIVAQNFFKANPLTRGDAGSVKLVWTAAQSREGATRSSSKPTFYVFNHTAGGFVIVAADDAARPVIAYSYQGSFSCNDMPDNLREWADNISGQIADGRAAGDKPTVETSRMWANALSATKAAADTIPSALLIETALWGQGVPFNTYCPEVDGEKAVVGCTAVSLGIVLNFYKHPVHGNGTVPSYSYTKDSKSYTIPSKTLGYDYDWNNIRMSYPKNGYTETEGKAVGLLLYDLAIMGKSSFGSSTGSGSKKMSTAATQYMGIDQSIQQLYRGYYGDEIWFEMVKKELQHNPMPYSCSVHAFVVDGYDAEGRLHVNWGWSGSSNGYFEVNAFVPTSSRNYTKSNNGIFNFRPDEGGKAVPMLKLEKATSSSSGKTYTGLTLVSGQLVQNSDITVTVGYVVNAGIINFTGELVLAHCNKNNEIKELIMEPWNCSISVGYMSAYSNRKCHISLPTEDGDKVKLFQRYDGYEDWSPVFFSNEEDSDFVGELVMLTYESFTDNTSITYYKTSRTYEIKSFAGSSCNLTGPSGDDASSVVTTVGDGVFSFSKEDLTAGTYTLDIHFGTYTKSIKLTVKR